MNKKSTTLSLQILLHPIPGIQRSSEPCTIDTTCFLCQNSIFWAQRVRLQWLTNDDQNISFFHNAAKICKHRNNICALKDNAGNIFTTHSDFENCFVDFYKNHWTPSSSLNLDQVFYALLDDFSTLFELDKDALTKPISKGVVYRILRSIPRGKGPGPDGLGLEFYLFYWSIIGDQLFNDVSYFFQTSKIPKAWGKTFVVLIPKKDSPQICY